jgi:peptidyl-prolyl cis-trans isomerase A (cyclophilin A)
MRRGQFLLTAALTLATLVSTACAQVTSKKVEVKPTTTEDDKPVVVLDTTAGKITIELDRAKAPITVENFLKYVDSEFFDGLVFHRVIPGFMIQGGGMTADSANNLKEKTPTFPPIKNESRTGLSNARGTIAMARTGDPNSATSQFFINHSNNSRLDTMGGGYTAFGKVTDGMDVVDAIAKTKTDLSEGEGGVPVKAIVIKSIKRKPKS